MDIFSACVYCVPISKGQFMLCSEVVFDHHFHTKSRFLFSSLSLCRISPVGKSWPQEPWSWAWWRGWRRWWFGWWRLPHTSKDRWFHTAKKRDSYWFGNVIRLKVRAKKTCVFYVYRVGALLRPDIDGWCLHCLCPNTLADNDLACSGKEYLARRGWQTWHRAKVEAARGELRSCCSSSFHSGKSPPLGPARSHLLAPSSFLP